GVPKYTLIEPLGHSPRLFLLHKTKEESVAAKLSRFDRKLRQRPQRDAARSHILLSKMEAEHGNGWWNWRPDAHTTGEELAETGDFSPAM
ncbi:MAG: hypothetical protein KAT30_15045, partial [Candidatus Krumholzibacteria bacterium]|nr:hypothetical protein [Candidatus Krumholzibacteria bacterium]